MFQQQFLLYLFFDLKYTRKTSKLVPKPFLIWVILTDVNQQPILGFYSLSLTNICRYVRLSLLLETLQFIFHFHWTKVWKRNLWVFNLLWFDLNWTNIVVFASNCPKNASLYTTLNMYIIPHKKDIWTYSYDESKKSSFTTFLKQKAWDLQPSSLKVLHAVASSLFSELVHLQS